MNNSAYFSRLGAFALVVSLILVATPPAMAVTGAIPGQFAVSETGAATYTIPIAAPPGTAGMEPKLALAYNSQGGNGLLGVGGSLSGLSAVTRCPRTIAQDGANAGVEYGNSDKFCLDGQRLIAVSGTYGANGTEYRTEIESFAKVVSYGTAGNGPAWFKVWTKSGQIMEYGNTTDSRIEAQGKATAAVWALNKAGDTKGNYFTVTYAEDNTNGQFHPSRIDYTGNANSGLAPYNSVQFTYETRPDTSPQYVGGSLNNLTQRLTTIRSYAGGTLAQEYRLSYQNDAAPNNASRLTSVTQCAGDGACMSPTTLGWQVATGSSGFTASGWTVPYTASAVAGSGDFNGDGLMDLYYTVWNGFNNTIYIRYANDSGFGSPVYAGVFSAGSCGEATCPAPIAVGDFNGDGRADLAASGNRALLSTGNGFVQSAWTVPNLTATQVPFGAGDFNGDGRDDLYYVQWNGISGTVYVTYSTGSGFGAAVNAGSFPGVACGEANCPPPIAVGDFNGDGRADLAVILAPGSYSLILSTGNGFTSGATYQPYSGPAPTMVGAGDFNGDGRQDLYYALWNGMSNTVHVMYSNGLGFALPVNAGSFSAGTCGDGTCPLPIASGDFDGDGRSDLASLGSPARMAKGPTPDLLNSITSGLNASTTIAYKPLTDSTVYTAGGDAIYPVRDIKRQGPIYVVASVGGDDGIGGESLSSYTYRAAQTNLAGRGFLGFHSVTVHDSASGITTQTDYRQDYPYTGLPGRSTRTSPGGVLLSQTDITYSAQSLGGTRYFPYAAQSVESRYELDGSLIASTTTTQQYDGWGNPTQIVVATSDGHSKTTVNTYSNDNANWLLGRLTRAAVTSTLPGGSSATRTSAFEYDAASGLLSKEIVEPDTPQLRLDTAYVYDAYGNKISVTVSSPAVGAAVIQTRTRTTGYAATAANPVAGQFPTTSTNALGHSETQEYDHRNGKVTKLTGPNGLTTTWDYDGFGRKVKETRADATWTTWSYEACGSGCPDHAAYLIRATDYASTGASLPPSQVYYDKLSREVRSRGIGFDGRYVHKDTEYNDRGLVYRVSRPYYDNEAPQWTISSYDDLGRPYHIEDADGGVTTYAYQGVTTITTNPKGQNRSEVKNSQGQLVSVADADNFTTTFTYDPFGNLTRTLDPNGNPIVNTYDTRGRKVAMDDPDMGHWTYVYNALGELVSQTDAKGQTVSNTYDKLGRLTRRAEPDLITDWYYDKYKDGSACAAGVGKLCEVSSDNNMGQRIYYEGAGGRISVVAHVIDTTYLAYRGYDEYGRASTQSVNAVFATRNVYNPHGHLAEVRRDSDNGLLWRADARDAEGRVTQETLGNGVTTTHAYNAQNGRLTSIQANGPNGAVQNQGYTYDNIGNLATRNDSLLSSSESFTYDTLNRLTGASKGGVSVSVQYDSLGNITHKSDVGAYTYGRPHAVAQAGSNAYTYDANGNVLTSAGRTLAWTSYNLPNQITEASGTTTFLYDYNHVRAYQANGTKTVVYLNPRIDLGGHYHKETAGAVVTERYYFYAGGKVVGAYVTKTGASPQTHYFHADHLGSISVVTDQTGQVIARYAFDPWGKRTLAAGSNATIHGFTGHEHLEDGLIHMNGRVYDPVLARFLSADPHIQDPGNLQSWNRYSYVLNNLSFPRNFVFQEMG